jgi:hypothetical protein
MNLIKVGECYVNLENITHAEFETSTHGLMCTAHFNCQITDRNGCNGIQASKTFTAGEAQTVKAWLDSKVDRIKP